MDDQLRHERPTLINELEAIDFSRRLEHGKQDRLEREKVEAILASIRSELDADLPLGSDSIY